ncbi:MAG TPA: hypothetical protein VKR58_01055 [Aquella sp.]|nr:hypothetical protein [Aquella sp.]
MATIEELQEKNNKLIEDNNNLIVKLSMLESYHKVDTHYQNECAFKTINYLQQENRKLKESLDKLENYSNEKENLFNQIEELEESNNDLKRIMKQLNKKIEILNAVNSNLTTCIENIKVKQQLVVNKHFCCIL